MTIAISLRVNDGVVLAADSATSLMVQNPGGGAPLVANVYNNANKIFNLRKGLPIGLITWGSGSIGSASIATLVKDLRRRLTGGNDWALDAQNYSVTAVAERVKEFFLVEHYTPAFAAWPIKPPLGFVIAGYSSGSPVPEEYMIQIDNTGACTGPVALRQADQVGVTWNGFPEPITRLIFGIASNLPQLIMDQLPEEQRAAVGRAIEIARPVLQVPLVQAAMPLQDAIDLAEYLAELTIGFSRFAPGASVVGGPVEIAAITKHEGFKWVSRKYYFQRDLNPEETR